METGIAGLPGPPLENIRWIDGNGDERDPLTLADLGPGFKILFFFQDWCPGCHSHGFPTLVKLVEAFRDKGIGLAAIQTVFEGFEEFQKGPLEPFSLAKHGHDRPPQPECSQDMGKCSPIVRNGLREKKHGGDVRSRRRFRRAPYCPHQSEVIVPYLFRRRRRGRGQVRLLSRYRACISVRINGKAVRPEDWMQPFVGKLAPVARVYRDGPCRGDHTRFAIGPINGQHPAMALDIFLGKDSRFDGIRKSERRRLAP